MSIYDINGKSPIAAYIPTLDDAGNGTTTLTDLVGSNNGTLTNMDPATDWVADSDAGGTRALEFSGSASEAVTGGSGALTSGTRPLSFTWWYKGATEAAARHWIYQNNISSAGPNLAFVIERVTNVSHRLGIYSGGYVYSTAFSWDLDWHHYAISWSADNSCSFYRDGGLVSSSTIIPRGSPDSTWQFNRLASGSGVAGFSMTGRLDDVRKWLLLLDTADMSALYAGGNGRGLTDSGRNMAMIRRRRTAGGGLL